MSSPVSVVPKRTIMKPTLKLFGIAMTAPLFVKGAAISQSAGSGASITTLRIVLLDNRIITTLQRKYCCLSSDFCESEPIYLSFPLMGPY